MSRELKDTVSGTTLLPSKRSGTVRRDGGDISSKTIRQGVDGGDGFRIQMSTSGNGFFPLN